MYANDGTLIKGITTYASEFSYEYGLPVKKVIPITENIVKNGKTDFYIDGACNNLQGNLCSSGKITLLETACKTEFYRVFRTYLLRHTFCTDCQAAGVPINVAKELMGHSDISVTANTYTHMIDEVFEQNRKRLGNYASQKQSIVTA